MGVRVVFLPDCPLVLSLLNHTLQNKGSIAAFKKRGYRPKKRGYRPEPRFLWPRLQTRLKQCSNRPIVVFFVTVAIGLTYSRIFSPQL